MLLHSPSTLVLVYIGLFAPVPLIIVCAVRSHGFWFCWRGAADMTFIGGFCLFKNCLTCSLISTDPLSVRSSLTSHLWCR